MADYYVKVSDENDFQLPQVVVDNAPFAKSDDLADVATSGDYDDLEGKPALAGVATSGAYDDLEGKPDLSSVATSGDYDDLQGKPSIPSTAGDVGAIPVTAFDSALAGASLIAYGTSYVVGGPWVTSDQRYTTLLANSFGMNYAAADMRGVNGSGVDSAANGAIGTGVRSWEVGRKGVVVIQPLMNTMRLKGATPAMLLGVENYLRSMLSVLCASARTESGNPPFTESGTWTTGATTNASGGSWRSTTTASGYAEFVAAGGEYVICEGRADTAGTTITVTDQTAAITLGTFSTISQTDSSLGTVVPMGFRIPLSAAGHTVRFTRGATGGNSLAIDVVLPQLAKPNIIVALKEPYLADWSLSSSFPNGSDAGTDQFNAIWDKLALEFPSLVVADPNAGYWTKETSIGDDGVHPNVQGHQQLFACVRDATRRGLISKVARSVLV